MKKISKRTIILVVVLIALVSFGFVRYYQIQVHSLQSLGYTQEESKKMVNPLSIYHIVTNTKDDLLVQLDDVKKELNELGINEDAEKGEMPLVGQVKELKSLRDEKIKFLKNEISTLEKEAKILNISYEKEGKSLYNQYSQLTLEVNKKIKKENKKNITFLEENGYSKNEINKLKTKDNFKTYENILKAVNKEKKIKKENNGFASAAIKNEAMRMFKETNQYRKSKGLAPYKYNYNQQACVFLEANGYANNGNPHNWLCKAAANENAGLANVNSDYVGSAMTFFKNDPPHEAVLSGNYRSVAIAFVERNGMMYMIMDVFN